MCFLCTLEEAAKRSPELPESRQAVAALETSQASSEGEMTQVFKSEEVDGATAGENGKEGMEAKGASPAGEVSPLTEIVQPFQPEHNDQLQSEQLCMEPEATSEEKADKMIPNDDCITAPVAGVECTTTSEEHPLESTDGGEDEVFGVTEEKPLSVEGSERGQQSPDDEEESNKEGEDDSDAGREGGGRSESEGDNAVQTDRGPSLG